MENREVLGIIVVIVGVLIMIDIFDILFTSIFSLISARFVIGIIVIGIGIWIFHGKENTIEERKDKQKSKKK